MGWISALGLHLRWRRPWLWFVHVSRKHFVEFSMPRVSRISPHRLCKRRKSPSAKDMRQDIASRLIDCWKEKQFPSPSERWGRRQSIHQLCKRKIPSPKDEDSVDDDQQSKESVDLHFANPVRTGCTHATYAHALESISTPAIAIACKHTHTHTHTQKHPQKN
jgi:hypothetical protein